MNNACCQHPGGRQNYGNDSARDKAQQRKSEDVGEVGETQSVSYKVIGQQAGDDADQMTADNLPPGVFSLSFDYEHKCGWAQAWKNKRLSCKPGDQRRYGKEESHTKAIFENSRHDITDSGLLHRKI